MPIGGARSRSGFFKRSYRKSISALKSFWVWSNIVLFNPTAFRPNACDRAQEILRGELVGQAQGVEEILAAVCDHVSDKNTMKPLMMSIHGSPGIGKSYSHLLLARSLYNVGPTGRCPGEDCRAYMVIGGIDYIDDERKMQLGKLRALLEKHVSDYKEPIIVFEDFEKIDCTGRYLLASLAERWLSGEKSLRRAIIILVSNEGHELIHRGKQDSSRSFNFKNALKDHLLKVWTDSSITCSGDPVLEDHRFLNKIDHVIPFYPLSEEQIQTLLERELQKRRKNIFDGSGNYEEWSELELEWSDDVIKFLSSKIEFDQGYSIEGAFGIRSAISQFLTTTLSAAYKKGIGRSQAPNCKTSLVLQVDKPAVRLVVKVVISDCEL